MLQLDDIHFAHGATTFHFDAAFETGSFTAIIGPSGAGKSTLLDIIAGFAKPLSGAIAFEGKDITGLDAATRPVAILFQDNNLFAHLDVFTNVGLGRKPDMSLSDADKSKVHAALKRVGLEGFDNRLPGALSGGERQRVALARVLVQNKPILLLDEPFASLGPRQRHDMLALVGELQAEKGLTVLMVSHHPGETRTATTHTAFVNEGRIEILTDTASFFADDANARLAHYQGSS